MGLHVAQLIATGHVPRSHASHAGVIDHLARGRLAADFEARLGPSLSSQSAIVRIRRLSIRVVIPAADLNEDSLSRAWTRAFGRALFAALAYPAGAGPVELFRADSMAVFVAAAVGALLDGSSPDQWQFAEFEEFFSRGITEGAVALLCEWPPETLAILLELARADLLKRLLPRMDEEQLGRLFASLNAAPNSGPNAPGGAEPPALTVGDLIATLKLMTLGTPGNASALRSRRYAIQLYVAARMSGQHVPPLDFLHESLVAVALLIDDGELLRDGFLNFGNGCYPAAASSAASPSTKNAAVSCVEAIRRQSQDDARASSLVALNDLLTDLRRDLKLAPPSLRTEGSWISTDCCGIFFLLSTLDRLGWIAAWQDLDEFQSGGLSALLVGLALSIVERFETAPQSLDAGLALFAGYFDEPDLVHLRTMFQDRPPETAASVVRAVLGEDRIVGSWSQGFALLAEELLRAFAARIRGFRQASIPGVTQTFIQRPGRIRIEAERIVVVPQASAFHVALHISGLDAPVDASCWLGGRRVEFGLEDL